jgi:hypothetical protein
VVLGDVIPPRALQRRRWKPCWVVLGGQAGKVVGDATRPMGGASVMGRQGSRMEAFATF